MAYTYTQSINGAPRNRKSLTHSLDIDSRNPMRRLLFCFLKLLGRVEWLPYMLMVLFLNKKGLNYLLYAMQVKLDFAIFQDFIN
jgi:uncharacterized SAM-binding protein YcdF (DUF218 family)